MNYLQLIKTAISAVKAVEELMPDSPGKDKAAAAIELIQGVIGDVTAQIPALLNLFTVVMRCLTGRVMRLRLRCRRLKLLLLPNGTRHSSMMMICV